MARLVWTFSDVYTKVSEFLGLGSSPTGTNLTKVKDLVYRAYLKFLMPIVIDKNQTYIWSFCQKDYVLSTKANESSVILPEDFESFVSPLKYGPDDHYPMIEISIALLRKHRSMGLTGTSYPYEYALSNTAYSVETGQRRTVEFYPTPNDQYELYGTYAFTPEKPTSDTDYFVGGSLASECILEMSLAEAEAQEDETIGTHSAKATALFNQLLRQDMPKSPSTLPTVVDGALYQYDPFTWRANQINSGPMTVYDQEFD